MNSAETQQPQRALPVDCEDNQAGESNDHQRDYEQLAPRRLGAAVLGMIVPSPAHLPAPSHKREPHVAVPLPL